MKALSAYSVQDLAFFQDLSDEDLAYIRPALHFCSYAKGATVFRSGDAPEHMYFIADGRFKVTFLRPDGREQILYIYGKDDFIGGFNLIQDANYRYSTEALEQTVIARLTREAFDRFVLSHPALSLRFLNKAFERIRHSEALVMRLVYQDTDAKVAQLLLDLSERFGSPSKEGPLLQLSLTQEEMGNFAGLTRETTARRLSAFVERGLIRMPKRQQILLLDLPGLKALCFADEDPK